MKFIEYEDGSKSPIYETDDRVILKDYNDDWIAKSGDHAVVVRPAGHSKSPITDIIVRTDSMVAGGWGTITVPPWNLIPDATAK